MADDIDEWISFHVLAGVKHFYLYDNASVDGTAERALAHATGEVTVTVHPWQLRPLVVKEGRWKRPEVAAQELAYAHAVLNYGGRHQWMSFIDIDEFLVPVRHATLPEALEQLRDFSNISLPWHSFGDCGHQTRPPGPAVYAYRLRHQLSGSEVD
ncbi:MAG: glycosyltransferase family 92 protein, partial [Betaproteobacteria bacterium AqS2]|nr:glycosyltransferase family 92 protein [Betaproteobacteria bacterium AqS2]